MTDAHQCSAGGDGTSSPGSADPPNWREIEMMRLINILRAGEGDSVTLICDNPDFNMGANCAVECNGAWTDWWDVRFEADTLLDALSRAFIAYNNFEATGKLPDEPKRMARIPRPVGPEPGELTRALVADAMQDAWNTICSDTGCHPLDIIREGKNLFFQPRHWVDHVAGLIFARTVAASLSQPGSAAQRSVDRGADRVWQTVPLPATAEMNAAGERIDAEMRAQGFAGAEPEAIYYAMLDAAPPSPGAGDIILNEILKHVQAPNRPASERLDRIEEICVAALSVPSTQSSPPVQSAPLASRERLPSSDAAGAGGETMAPAHRNPAPERGK